MVMDVSLMDTIYDLLEFDVESSIIGERTRDTLVSIASIKIRDIVLAIQKLSNLKYIESTYLSLST